MTRSRILMLITAAAVLALAGSPTARQSSLADTRLQAALTKEVVEGKCDDAIALYEQVLTTAGVTHATAATALLQIGGCQEKANRATDARAVYQRIVREFGDQATTVAEARRRLLALAESAAAPPSALSTPAVRRVSVDDTFQAADVSDDGRLAVGQDGTGAIVLRELSTGDARVLVPASPAFMTMFPVLSRDGKFVAYGSMARAAGQGPRPVGLWTVSTEENAVPKAVVSQASGPTFLPADWSHDGRSILVGRGRGANNGVAGQLVPYEIDRVSVDDGSVRTIRTFELWRNPDGLTLSPDGRWLAYADAPEPPGDQAEQFVYVLDVEGGNETTAVNMSGTNIQPKWAPDSRHLLFFGDRTGAALWSVEVDAGRPVAEPELVRAGITRGLLRVSSSGSLFFARTAGNEFTTFVVETSPAMKVIRAFSGDGPVISPDGQSVAFLKYLGPRDGSKPRPFELTVRSIETGQERVYRHPGLDRLPIRWQADSRALLVGINSDGGQGNADAICTVDLASGVFTPLVARDGPTARRSLAGALSRDGRTMYMAARRDSSAVSRIVAVDVATGSERAVADFPLPGLPAVGRIEPALSLSPDGKMLVLLTIESPRDIHLHLVPTDGGQVRELPGPFALPPLSWPAWLPDSQAIVVGRLDQGRARLVRMPIDGTSPEVLAFDFANLAGQDELPRIVPATVGGVSFSDDGTRMAFQATTATSHEIWAIDKVLALVPSGGRR